MARERRQPKRSGAFWPLLAVVVLVLAAALVLPRFLTPGEPTEGTTGPIETTQTLPTVPTETTLPPAPHVVATASISAQGDLLMHMPVINTASKGGGSYDFSSIYRHLTEVLDGYDYSVANLETTLAGSGVPYRGYPSFNCPDAITDDSRAAGYDMLLTANNHSYDTSMSGVNRTLEQVREAGLASLGTRLSAEEKRYTIVDLNGIQVGMVCYTVSLGKSESGGPRLNSGAVVKYPEQVNYFFNDELESFYSEIGGIYDDMMAEGAEASILYIHWGIEYQTKENETQRQIAQKMCDLGFDVIVGGHPHVVQPMALLTSSADPEHHSVCIYSLGNAVSNQRRANMNLKTGHTEDGVLLGVTFEEYSDGQVFLAGVEALPTWVNMSSVHGQKEYNILPLDGDTMDAWKDRFSLTGSLYENAKASYQRTMDIIGPGLDEIQNYLDQQKELRDSES